MFDNVMSLFFGLSYETAILEACDWDEERAEEVGKIFSHTLSKCITKNLTNKEDALEIVRENLCDSTSETERKALINLLQESFNNIFLLINSSDEYEN
tara:strand:- start:889 stop:1182 length:294 start_codon:yes stop_codon:yes gene_type:complete